MNLDTPCGHGRVGAEKGEGIGNDSAVEKS